MEIYPPSRIGRKFAAELTCLNFLRKKFWLDYDSCTGKLGQTGSNTSSSYLCWDGLWRSYLTKMLVVIFVHHGNWNITDFSWTTVFPKSRLWTKYVRMHSCQFLVQQLHLLISLSLRILIRKEPFLLMKMVETWLFRRNIPLTAPQLLPAPHQFKAWPHQQRYLLQFLLWLALEVPEFLLTMTPRYTLSVSCVKTKLCRVVYQI